MNRGLVVQYGSSECGVLVRLAVVRENTGPASKPDEVELSLVFKNTPGDSRYSGTMPDQKVFNAAAKMAGIRPIRILRNVDLMRQLICASPDTADEIQLGIFLVYLVKYTKQAQ